MTTVNRRAKTNFQKELDKVIIDRKSRGFGTGFSEDEEVEEEVKEGDSVEIGDSEDDFNVDDFLKQYSKPDKKSANLNKTQKNGKWKVPSYLEDDDDDDEDSDDMVFDSSKFLKKPTEDHKKSKVSRNEKFPAMGKTSSPFTRQQAVAEETKDKVIPALSPRQRKSPLSSPQHSISSPRRALSPTLGKSERNQDRSMAVNQQQTFRNSVSFSGDKIEVKKSGEELKNKIRPKERTKKHEDGNELENLLASIKSDSNKENYSKDINNKNLTEDKDSFKNSQSIIDFLMDDSAKPKPAPRKQGSVEVNRNRSHSGDRPGSAKSRDHSPPSVISGKKRRERKKPEESKQDFLKLEPIFGTKKSTDNKESEELNNITSPKSSLKRTKSTEGDNLKEGNTADDLLALFEQTQIDTAATKPTLVPISNQIETDAKEDKGNALDEVVKQTDDSTVEPKQRSSQQLISNVIDNVATHNNEVNMQQDQMRALGMKEEEIAAESVKSESTVKKKKRVKSGVKSYRTPPVGYKGLGSTTSLKQLKHFDSTQDLESNSSIDIRNSVYLEWLADREKKKKAAKKVEEARIAEENEKKEKEKRDRIEETNSTRDAWMEKKNETMKEREAMRRKQERKERKEKMRKEEEKWKSEKKADARRKNALEEARKNHRAEQKKINDEKLLKQKQEREKKEESKKASKEWTEKKEERIKKERREKQREEREKKKKAEEEERLKKEEAEEKYLAWKERKENEQNTKKRTVYHDAEERPMWSPANKVIPRTR